MKAFNADPATSVHKDSLAIEHKHFVSFWFLQSTQKKEKKKSVLKKVKVSNLQLVYFMVNGTARCKTPQQWSMLLKPTTQIMR